MHALLRLTSPAAALVGALASAATVAAAPALQVASASHVLGHAGALAVITRQDPSAYRTTVLAPAAYQAPDIEHLGQQVGTAVVQVTTAAGPMTFAGWVTGESPLGFVEDSCAAFAGQQHLAVWLVQVRQTDGIARAEIPVFVDAAPGGRTELTWCASSAADMTVTAVSLRLTNVFVNPIASGAYTWRATFDLATADSRTTLGDAATSATATVRL
jgi:hypothetical protein